MSGTNLDQLAGALRDKLIYSRIVSWLDLAGEYAEIIEQMETLLGVPIIVVDGNEFSVKIRVLADHPKEKFVLYRKGELPPVEDDWLADIRLGYATFRADSITLQATELGLTADELVATMRAHAGFFNSRDRVTKLRSRLRDSVDSKTLLAMMTSTLLGTADHSFSHLFAELASSAAPPAGEEPAEGKFPLLKYGLDDFFWDGAAKIWNYDGQKDLPALVLWLFLQEQNNWPESANANARADFRSWFNALPNQQAVQAWAAYAAEKLSSLQQLSARPAGELLQNKTVPGVDELLVRQLADELVAGSTNAEAVRKVAAERQNTIWYERSRNTWKALLSGAECLTLIRTMGKPLFADAADGFFQYTDRWWKIDQAYRQFLYFAAGTGGDSPIAVLKQQVETAYIYDYQQPLAHEWDGAIRQLGGWKIPARGSESAPSRQDRFVALNARSGRRTIVIISDALRFEVGKELEEKLNRQGRFTAQTEPWYTLLPSVTKLGMAALLPHGQLEFTEKSEVRLDGASAEGTERRDQILADAFAGRAGALTFEDARSMNRDQIRDYVRERDVVYIYHNEIDAIGDSGSSEMDTPGACQRTLEALCRLCTQWANYANTARIIITADHGFLYQERALEDNDTVLQGQVPAGKQMVGKMKRRYALGKNLQTDDNWTAFTAEQIGLAGGLDVAVPRGLRRHRVSGKGRQFVHGGASLQEITIPVITVTVGRQNKTEDARIELHYSQTAITTPAISARLVQKDPVGGKTAPFTAQIGLYAQDGALLSDLVTVEVNSPSQSQEQRNRNVQLALTAEANAHNNQDVYIRAHKLVNGNQVAAVAEHKVRLLHSGFNAFGGFDI